MNLELSKNEIFNILGKRKINISKLDLFKQLKETFKFTKNILEIVMLNPGLELQSKSPFPTNPIKWEFGHILFFWQELCCKLIGIDFNIVNPDIYDSFKISNKDRFVAELVSVEDLYEGFNLLFERIINYIFENELSDTYKYIIRLSHLHQEMHNESFIFTFQTISKLPLSYKFDYDNLLLRKTEFIDVPGGKFIQGTSDDFYFDNEYPPFEVKLSPFKVSKYCITNFQYLQFVEAGGYKNSKYWIPSGWRWIKRNKMKHPVYWRYDSDNKKWEEKLYDKYIKLRSNFPVVNITYYEASAYCKWAGYRLPRESEWEYMTTFFKDDYKKNGHFDYKNGTTISVLKDNNINSLGIVGLYGNVWEWCLEPIYPYDGFVIDPVYREMSYPFFGYKRICRGGSWCSPKYLVTKTYRNAQPFECNYQYIGFRVVT